MNQSPGRSFFCFSDSMMLLSSLGVMVNQRVPLYKIVSCDGFLCHIPEDILLFLP